ncbi:G-protein coupled receptor GRL101-like [Ylistrum balloti]|uniref:G-protein coupled receptor GRL101-like n=1 Tax=Ylistrum balloti TaxID=509963 RepID=UPI002905EDFA|nr:G-protein coupled receptor GRL101-like [Ylistrum balloti]
MFEGLDNLKMLFTDIPFMCCVKPPSVDDNNCFKTKYSLWQCTFYPGRCKSENDAISSCFALIGSTLLRVCLWIIGMCSLIGNLAVIVYRLHIDKDNITKNYSLFTVNLAMSDLLMGVYLFIIGVIDVYYDGVYAWNNNRWRNSVLCTAAGILSSVSSEMSTFLILMVTIDRLIAIMFPLSRLSRWRNSWKLSLLVLVSLWIVSIILATIPIVASQSYFKGEFYSQSSVCLGLPLTAEQRPGTEYSFAVFVCLNSAVFTVIVVGQICIWKGMRESRRRISSSQNRERETAVARTLFFVVATDFCCWFPIGVMGVASKCGVEIPNGVYAWVMVFVLPINAAINPFLYTATAVWRKRRTILIKITSSTRPKHLPSASIDIQTTPVGRDIVASTDIQTTPVGRDVVTSTDIQTTSVGSDVVASTDIQTSVGRDVVASTDIQTTSVGGDVVASTDSQTTPVGRDVVTSTDIQTTSVGRDVVASTDIQTSVGRDVVASTDIQTTPVGRDVVASTDSQTTPVGRDVVTRTDIQTTPVGRDVVTSTDI